MASTKRQCAFSTLGAGMTLLCALNVHATAGTYRWMEDQGRVHYSDRMPPESADRAYTVINPHGITVKSIDKTKTPEQLAEEREIQRQREEDQRQERERRLQDRNLMDTYSTVDDLIDTRDRHIATLEGLIDVSQHKLSNLNTELDKITKMAANLARISSC